MSLPYLTRTHHSTFLLVSHRHTTQNSILRFIYKLCISYRPTQITMYYIKQLFISTINVTEVCVTMMVSGEDCLLDNIPTMHNSVCHYQTKSFNIDFNNNNKSCFYLKKHLVMCCNVFKRLASNLSCFPP